MDNAACLTAWRTRARVPGVATRADILVVPNLNAGNMFDKRLTYSVDADAAGVLPAGLYAAQLSGKV